jgi:succinate-semialdehyde dehydrogenase/glutarate-semialdehyde dehydrogenase
VFADVRNDMRIAQDEIFGPVACLIPFDDEADAIRIANDSPFGLGSGVLTGDPARGERIATEALEAGMSFVNANVRSDSRLPFGGVKHSGYGREKGFEALHGFTTLKTVVIKHG